jgi:site-specific recombinase XerD
MKNIKSIIKRNTKNSNNESLIYIRYTYNRKYILFRTDVYIKPFLFTLSTGRVKKSSNYELKNRILRQKELETEKIVLQLMSEGLEPTLFFVKQRYWNNDKSVSSENHKKIVERKFHSDYKKFAEYRKHHKQISKGTYDTYVSTMNKLSEFQKEEHFLVDYNTINSEFYDKFLLFLYGQNLMDNSIDKHIKNLKTFMKHSLYEKYHTNSDFIRFKRTRTKTDFAILDIDEIRKVYKYNPSTPKLKDIRNTFLLGLSTGLRFSDLSDLTQGNFVIHRTPKNVISQSPHQSFIKVRSKKTGDYLKIPFNNFIVKLIDEYDIENKPLTFNKMSIYVFNKEVKVVCEKSGIKKLYTITNIKGKKENKIEKMKYEFISSHTMRRSFISSLSHYTTGSTIQSITGHKDIQTLNEYIKHTDKEMENITQTLNSSLFNF